LTFWFIAVHRYSHGRASLSAKSETGSKGRGPRPHVCIEQGPEFVNPAPPPENALCTPWGWMDKNSRLTEPMYRSSSGSSSLSQVMFGGGSPAAGQRRVSALPAGDATIGDSFLPTQRGPSTQQSPTTQCRQVASRAWKEVAYL